MKSQFIVQTDIFPNASFTKFSGLDDQAQTITYADGVAYEKYYLVGMTQLQAMNITIPHDPENHDALINYHRENPCSTFTVTITPVRCNPNETVGSSLTLLDCKMTQVQAFSVDRDENAMANIVLHFVADDYRLD